MDKITGSKVIVGMALLFLAVGTAQGGVIISETFDTDGSIDLYTGAGELFGDYAATGAPVAAASGGELRLALEGGTAGTLYTRIDLGGAQSMLSMRYDYKATAYGAAGVPWAVYIGAFGEIGDFAPGWNIHGGDRNWSMSNTTGNNPYDVIARDGANTPYTQSGYSLSEYYTWSLFLNQSGSTQQFLGPDGVTTYTLDNERWSLFVDNTVVADNVIKGTASDADTIEGIVFNLARNWDGGVSDQSIDNILIRDDLAMYVPEPATLALLSLGGLGLLRRKR